MDQSENGEYQSRLMNARDGEVIKTTRSMQGQAPIIINSYLSYVGAENGMEANLSYNVQGKSLSIVGIGLNPDVYQSPFHSLNFKLSKRVASNGLKISAGVQNILGATKLRVFESFNAANQNYDRFHQGRSFSFSLSYDLF